MRSDLMNTGGLVIATFNEIEVDSWVSHVPMAVFVDVLVSRVVLQDTETSSWIGKTGEKQQGEYRLH